MKAFDTNTVEVKLYGNRASMRKAIRKIGYNCDHTESMVIPVTVYSFKDGRATKSPVSSEMYIHRGISMPVLVHESLHAATVALRRKKESVDLGRKIQYREELLAYTQTAILQDILKHFFPKTNSAYDFKNIKWWARNSVKDSRK